MIMKPKNLNEDIINIRHIDFTSSAKILQKEHSSIAASPAFKFQLVALQILPRF